MAGNKRIILANPTEPRAGDYAYGLYDKAHPVTGDPETIQRLRSSLRGLRGQDVTVTFNGAHIDSGGKIHRFRIKRSLTLNAYSDIFGPGSAYASAVKTVRDKHSDELLVTYGITVEPATGEDDGEDET